MSEVSIILPWFQFAALIAQVIVVFVLIGHAVSLSRQLKEARRDHLVRIRIQLGDLYIRYQDQIPLVKRNLRGQMKYLLTNNDRLSKELKDTDLDEFLEIIRAEAMRDAVGSKK